MSEELQATIAEQAREIERLQAESFESLYDAVIDERDAVLRELAALKQPISDERELISEVTGFGFEPGELQTFNENDLLRLVARARLGNAVVMPEIDRYDAGLLNDFGGGNVEWWQGYIRAELDRAHDFYQSQVSSLNPSRGVPANSDDHSADDLNMVKAPHDLLLEAIAVLMLYTRGSASREGILINDLRALLDGGAK